MAYYDDPNYEYKMPSEIKSRFTMDMMKYFTYKFTEIFKHASTSTPLSYYDFVYEEGTAGWQEAFDAMCREYGLDDVAVYVDNLEWYDYDWFCGEFTEMLLRKRLVVDDLGEQDEWEWC